MCVCVYVCVCVCVCVCAYLTLSIEKNTKQGEFFSGVEQVFTSEVFTFQDRLQHHHDFQYPTSTLIIYMYIYVRT